MPIGEPKIPASKKPEPSSDTPASPKVPETLGTYFEKVVQKHEEQKEQIRKQSKYITEVEGWPSDPEDQSVLIELANAMGEHTLQRKIEKGRPLGSESDELNKMAYRRRSLEDAFRSRFPGAIISERGIFWDGRYVKLSI